VLLTTLVSVKMKGKREKHKSNRPSWRSEVCRLFDPFSFGVVALACEPLFFH
jgi:hypothetical protein